MKFSVIYQTILKEKETMKSIKLSISFILQRTSTHHTMLKRQTDMFPIKNCLSILGVESFIKYKNERNRLIDF